MKVVGTEQFNRSTSSGSTRCMCEICCTCKVTHGEKIQLVPVPILITSILSNKGMNRFCNDLRSTQSHPHIARTRQSCSKHGQYSTLPSEMRFSLAQVAQMLDSTGNFPQSVSQAMTDARASSQSSGRVRTRKIERERARERAPTEGRKRELMTGRQSLATVDTNNRMQRWESEVEGPA